MTLNLSEPTSFPERTRREHSQLLTLIEQMLQLGEQKAETLRKLQRLVHIADLLGKPLAQIDGKVWTRFQDLEHRMTNRWNGYIFIIVTQDGQEHRFNMTSVPLQLWPDQLRAEYERHLASRTKRIPIRTT